MYQNNFFPKSVITCIEADQNFEKTKKHLKTCIEKNILNFLVFVTIIFVVFILYFMLVLWIIFVVQVIIS